ncbi:MAG: cation:proton antiporter [Paracoccaceae bacterium]|nr:cation:proton antiporter [Paracoccaceae bacterium]
MFAFIVVMLVALLCVEVVHRRFNLQVIVTAIVCGYLVGGAIEGLQRFYTLGSGRALVFGESLVDPVRDATLVVLMATAGACIPFENMRSQDIGIVFRLVVGAGVSFAASCVMIATLSLFPQTHEVFDIGARNTLEATLIVSLCTFVTSLPFLTKIFQSLDLLNTRLSRNILLASCIGDLIVYVATSIFIALATAAEGWVPQIASHVAHIAGFLLLFVGLFRVRALRPPGQEVWLLPGFGFLVLAGITLDVGPLLTGMFAGLYFGERGWSWLVKREGLEQATKQIGTLYFVLVGLSLTTHLQFDPVMFVIFLTFTSVVKIASVFACIAQRLRHLGLAFGYAVAMNTRGGPGIVLASIFFTEGLIGQDFFIVLIMTSIVTAMMTEVFLKGMASLTSLKNI